MNKVYDLCVIGTGPSALSLVESYLKEKPSNQVIVLEAGEGLIDLDSDLSDRKSTVTDFKLDPTINIGLGGTSQLWHNVLAPLDQDDFITKSWVKQSGWPIQKNDLDPYYRKVSKFFGFDYSIFSSPENFIDSENELSKVKYDQEYFETKVFVHPLDYLRTNRNFINLKKKYRNLTIKTGSVALNFDFGKKLALNVFDRKKNIKNKVYSIDYVISAGAFNSTEILLNTEQIKKGLPCLGHYLMDHPMGNFYQYEYKNPICAKIFSGIKFEKDIKIKVALRLKPEIQRKMKLGNFAFFLRPSFSKGFNNKTENLKHKLLTVRSKLKQGNFPLSETWDLIKDLNMVRQIIQYKTGLLSKHKLTDLMFVSEQRPSVESRVVLSKEINKYGNRRIDIKWNVSNKDIHDIESIKEIIDEKLMSLNDAKQTFDPSEYNWSDRLTSAAHHLGTIRMSQDKKSGCVDKNLKLHGFDHIYVCDGSVFTTSGNANPTMTCMALSMRLGEYLAQN